MQLQCHCAQCGSPLELNLVATVCPQCELRGALENIDDPTGLASDPGPILRNPEELRELGVGPGDRPGTGLLPVRIFGDYELLEEIARGGMGIVYKARQISLNRIVALKLLLFGELSSPDQVRRFRAEASAAASLQHSNIVAVHEVGVHGDQHYLAMDYVDGCSLREKASKQSLPAKRAAGYVKTIAEAVQYAHARGVLHRDLKPANVLIDANDQPRVTDFGLAKRLEDDMEMTVTGQVLGSPGYMPPEQALGKRGQASRGSDVYGLGATLYHLLTERPPFIGETVASTLAQVLNSDPIPPRLLNPGVPRDLEVICLKCLEKDPARRFHTAQALADELGRFLRDEPIQSRPALLPEKLARWCRRKPIVASLAGAAALFFILGSAGVFWQWARAERSARAELQQRREAEGRAYARAMNLAQQALAVNNLGRARQLLDDHRPKLVVPAAASQSDLPGWEWRYLSQECQSDAVSTLCQKPSGILSLAVSQDGKWLAVGEFEHGGLSVWNLHTRSETCLPAGDGEVIVAFSPKRSLLAFSNVTGAGSSNRVNSVRVWEATTGQFLATLPLTGPCRGLQFSNDGQTLVTSTKAPGSEITVWRLADGIQVASYTAEQITPNVGTPFAVTPNTSVAFHASREGRIRAIDLVTGQERWTTHAAEEWILALALSPDGKTLASGSGYAESDIRLFHSETGHEATRLAGHRSFVSALVFWPDGKTMASASGDQTIRLWNLATHRPAGILRGHSQEVWSLALLPDRTTLVSGCKDGTVCLWDTTSISRKASPITLPGKFVDWRFNSDSKSLITLDAQGHVAEWHNTNFQQMRPLVDLGTNFIAMRISDDGRLIAVGSPEGAIKVWDVHRRKLWRELPAEAGAFPEKFRSQGKKLIIGNSHNNSLAEWDLPHLAKTRVWIAPAAVYPHGTVTAIGRWIPLFAAPSTSARDHHCTAFSPNGRLCLTVGYSGASSLINMDTGLELDPRLDINSVTDATFSPDGELIVLASSAGVAKIWDTATLREIGALRGFLQGLHSAAFSPDGKRLALGSGASEAIKLWDVKSQQDVLTLEGHGSLFLNTAFSPDGNVLASQNRNGVVHLWQAPSWADIAANDARGGWKR